jgi:hypothetical protein
MILFHSANWKFTSYIAQERAIRLTSWKSFDEIAEYLATCKISRFDWERANKRELRECSRASFVLTVSHDVYDAFFNAPIGYRGQFAISEAQGEAANRKIIETLLSQLLDFTSEHPTPTREFVMKSLQSHQAKIWIDEIEVEDQLTDQPPSIDYREWEFNDPGGQGLRAPRGTTLVIKGGWVDYTGEEVRNPSKNNRSRNINRTGYSG